MIHAHKLGGKFVGNFDLLTFTFKLVEEHKNEEEISPNSFVSGQIVKVGVA